MTVGSTSDTSAPSRADRLLASMPVGFIFWDADWRCIGVNPEGEKLCGLSAGQLLGGSLWELFPAMVGTEFEDVYRRVARTGQDDSVEIFYPHPLNKWLDIYVTGDVDGVAAYFLDVSDRHTVQDRLASLAAHDRTVAQTLQNVLLPPLPAVDGVQIVARYFTAEGTDEVGGDWYDVIPGSAGKLTIAIGDVSGHDIAAAALMGQLRSMLRMTVWDHDDTPSQNVSRLDRAARDLGVHTTATLTLGVIEADASATDGARVLTLCNAGHLPPIQVHADGSTEIVNGDLPDILLGVAPLTPRQDHRYRLASGATLLLYTDGLVENRTDDLDARIDDLRALLTLHHRSNLESMVDAVVADMVGNRPEDDVAVLALRFLD